MRRKPASATAAHAWPSRVGSWRSYAGYRTACRSLSSPWCFPLILFILLVTLDVGLAYNYQNDETQPYESGPSLRLNYCVPSMQHYPD